MVRLLHHVVVVSPLLLEAIKDEVDAPASLFANLVKDAKNFVLLRTVCQTFAHAGKRTKRYACDAPERL